MEWQPKSDDTCPWSEELSDELLYEDAAQLSVEEQEDKIDTSEPPAILLQPPKCGCIVKLQNEILYGLLQKLNLESCIILKPWNTLNFDNTSC